MSEAARADEQSAGERRLGREHFIAGLGIGQICSWGSLYYAFPMIAEAMRSDLGWSKPELYGAATIGLLLSGIAAYPVGNSIDRGHGRTIMTAASSPGCFSLPGRRSKASLFSTSYLPGSVACKLPPSTRPRSQWSPAGSARATQGRELSS